MNVIVLNSVFCLTLAVGVFVTSYVIVKYARSRDSRQEIPLSRVIFGLGVWAFLSLGMLAAVFVCALASEPAGGRPPHRMLPAIAPSLLLCYTLAGYGIVRWVKRREEIQTLAGRLG